MKKIVVLGSTGMAGHIISLYLEHHGFDVFRISRSETNSDKSSKIDVSNTDELMTCIDEIKADVVVNCVGLLQKSCEERPDLAVLINSYLPHCLENHYRGTETKIIHLSTDCVFSGKKGSYTEEDLPDGRTFYDRSKALGEINNKKDLTFRMSIIGPDIDASGTGLLNWFMKQTGQVNGFTNALWNGITTLELAEAIEAAVNENISGVYHLVPKEYISKHDLLILFKKIFEKNDVDILPDSNFVMDKTLVNNRKDFMYLVKSYPEQLIRLRQWIEENSELYPDYYSKKTL